MITIAVVAAVSGAAAAVGGSAVGWLGSHLHHKKKIEALQARITELEK